MALEIRLLGIPEILVSATPVTLRTRKALALLAYLAVEQQPCTRDRLVDLLWPESDELLGRTSLRNALSQIRSALTDEYVDCLSADRDAAVFSLPPDAILDTQLLAEAAALAHRADPVGNDEQADLIETLRRASLAYRGDFVTGLRSNRSPEFEIWMTLQREHWHQQLSVVLARLAGLQLNAGLARQATETATRWLAHDPLSDAACRSLMSAQLVSGDRHMAMRTYQRHFAHLERELKCLPEPETQALAENIRSEIDRIPREQPSPMPSDVPQPAWPFVGRAQEFNRLVSAYYATIRTGARSISIVGEAGIGKTRLLQAFMHWIKTQDADLWISQGWEGGGQIPYQPLVDALRVRLEKESELNHLLDPVWLAELARLLPEIREQYGSFRERPSDEAVARQSLFEALARLGSALAHNRPIVWILEDIHWVDSDSLDALSYAMRLWARQAVPIMLIATVRAEVAEAEPLFNKWLTALSRDVACLVIELQALTQADIADFVGQLNGQSGGIVAGEFEPDEASAWLWEETSGHPLLLVETLQTITQSGTPLNEAMRRHGLAPQLAREISGAPGTLGESFTGIGRIVQWRMSRLSPAARDLSKVAAVLGQQFSFSTIVRIAEIPETATLAALEELLSSRILQAGEDPGFDGDVVYSFTHERIHAIILDGIHRNSRIILHRRALRVLETAQAAPAILARHALEGHQIELAFRYSMLAGELALEVSATQDAIYHLEQARRLLDERVGSVFLKATVPVASIERLYVNLSRAYEITTELDHARGTYQGLVDFANETHQTVLEWAALNRLAILEAQDTFDVAEAMQLVQQALVLAEQTQDRHIIAETEWNITQMANFAWLPDVALAHGGRAVALSRELGLTELTARSLYALGDTYCFAGKWEECVANLEEAQALYEGLRQTPSSVQSFAAQYIWAGLPSSNDTHLQAMQASCLWQLAEGYVHTGRLREGISTAKRALAVGVAMNNVWIQVMASVILSNALLDAGLYDEAFRVSKNAVSMARRIPNPSILLFSYSMFGTACQALFRLQTAKEAFQEALATIRDLPAQSYQSFVISKLCANSVLMQHWEEAYRFAKRSIANRRQTPTDLIVNDFSRSYEIMALLHNGDVETAREEVNLFESRVGANRRYLISFLQCSAEFAWAEGQPQRAIDCLQDAIRIADDIGLYGELWKLHGSLTQIYHAAGRDDDARQAVATATALVDRVAANFTDHALRDEFLTTITDLRYHPQTRLD